MKRILAPIVLLTLLLPSLAYGLTMEDLVERPQWSGLYYKKFTEVPFTGKVTGKCNFRAPGSASGEFPGICQGSFKNGKKVGPWVYYYDNGQLWSKVTYKDGNRDGPWISYSENGQLQSKGTYKDGDRYGPWVDYWDNGQLFQKGTFKDGKEDGPWVSYEKDGTVWQEYTGTFKDGVKVK